jgi:hypothetical protein
VESTPRDAGHWDFKSVAACKTQTKSTSPPHVCADCVPAFEAEVDPNPRERKLHPRKRLPTTRPYGSILHVSLPSDEEVTFTASREKLGSVALLDQNICLARSQFSQLFRREPEQRSASCRMYGSTHR